MEAGGPDSAEAHLEAAAPGDARAASDGGASPQDAAAAEAASDAGDERALASCPIQQSASAPAGAAVSGGFSGTDSQYYMLSTGPKCQNAGDCAAACVTAGGTTASCQAASSCVKAGSGRTSCVPPYYWLKASGALSESGMTANSAFLDILAADKYEDPLVLTNFKLTLGDGVTITGLQFKVSRNANSGMAVDGSVRVLKNGAPVGADHSRKEAWPTALDFATYGDANDTWGTTWTPADIRSPGFGLAIAPHYAGDPAGSDRAYIDSVHVTVFYTTPCN